MIRDKRKHGHIPCIGSPVQLESRLPSGRTSCVFSSPLTTIWECGRRMKSVEVTLFRVWRRSCPLPSERCAGLAHEVAYDGIPIMRSMLPTFHFYNLMLQKVDLVLLGGDLFHDNKPSRQTVIRAMEIFSRHCLSDQPIRFQVLSDQRQNFASGYGHVFVETCWF